MNCYSLTIGSRNTRAAAAKFSVRDDETIRKITRRYFPLGSTILNANGTWFDPKKKAFVKEESRQILVCASDRRELKGWYNQICFAMQQKSLMLVELGPVAFIDADPIKLLAMEKGKRAKEITGTLHQAPKTTF